MIFDLLWSPVFAEVSDPGLLTYFTQSNGAGKVIILILGAASLVAWTVMFAKWNELRKIQAMNRIFEKRLQERQFLFGPGNLEKVNPAVPYSYLYGEAVAALSRAGIPQAEGRSAGEVWKMRMGQVENALQRGVSVKCAEYESKMILLATIVSGAPFLGLLGTVWGVMDAFGAVALRATATLQMLAPGVSGALLTTVAGLVVAIPSVFGYNWLLSETKAMMTELENFASHLADRIEMENS